MRDRRSWKASKTKIQKCPEIFLVVFRDEMMDYKGKLRLVLLLSGKGRFLTSKLSNIWMNRQVWKHLFASVDWQAVNQIDWYLRRTFTNIIYEEHKGKYCVFPERFSDQFIFQTYQSKFILNKPQYKRKKSAVSLHTLISSKLHSVIIYVLHDNLKFKLENLAAAQFE